MSNETEKFDKLEEQFKLEKSQVNRQSIAKEQIAILKKVQMQLVEEAKKRGVSLNSYNFLEAMMEQYKGMKQIAERAGLETHQYDEIINKIKYKMFGKNV